MGALEAVQTGGFHRAMHKIYSPRRYRGRGVKRLVKRYSGSVNSASLRWIKLSNRLTHVSGYAVFLSFCVHHETMEPMWQGAPAFARAAPKISWIFGSSSSYSI